MNLLINKLSYLLERLLMLMMVAIVLTVTWQVFSRFVLSSPSSFTEEMSRFLLIWIGILGAAYAYKTKAHLGLDMFIQKMQGVRKASVLACIELITMVFAISVMIYGGSSLVSITLELKQTSAVLGVQMGYVYSVIPVSGGLICLFAIDNLCKIYTWRKA